jgi:23S rRNA (guanine2445-N2)-methyltransferase / 23S rRNA (guanine2069-N7)-methyltransferase
MASGKRFLNLFCYTASATVHAALGGARESTSVDMSATYLEWAERNLRLNGIDDARHRCVRADVLRWIEEERGRWDLIFLDPPSFSNSKRMEGTLDIQRDHVALLQATLRLLATGGTLLFSTNRRGFKLDTDAMGEVNLRDLSSDSRDPDFSRARLPHRLFRLQNPL